MPVGPVPLEHLCIENIPDTLSRLPTTLVYSQYRDSHFDNGFGIQTQMTRGNFVELFGTPDEPSQKPDVASKILDRYGVWQISCPEIRRTNVDQNSSGRSREYVVHRNGKDTYLHSDFSSDLSDTVIVSASNEVGNTLITTNRLALLLTEQNLHHFSKVLQDTFRTEIQRLLHDRHEYFDIAAVERILSECGSEYKSLPDCDRKAASDTVAGFSQGVVSNRYADFQAVAFSNYRMKHMPQALSQGTVVVMEHTKSPDLTLRQIMQTGGIVTGLKV